MLLIPPLAVPPNIVEEVSAIKFDVVQEHELFQQKLFYTTFLDSPYPSERHNLPARAPRTRALPVPQCPCPKGNPAEASPRQPSDTDLSTLPGAVLSLCAEMETAVAFSP